MSEDIEKEGKQVPSVSRRENTPVEETPRTNTRAKIDDSREIEETGEEK